MAAGIGPGHTPYTARMQAKYAGMPRDLIEIRVDG